MMYTLVVIPLDRRVRLLGIFDILSRHLGLVLRDESQRQLSWRSWSEETETIRDFFLRPAQVMIVPTDTRSSAIYTR